MSAIWPSASGNGRLELLRCRWIRCENFCHLLRTSMRRKQRKTSREVSRSSDAEPSVLIAVYCLQINSARARTGWRKQTPGSSSVASVWKSKTSFCILTSCFHSVSEINRRHFSAAGEPLRFPCARCAPRSSTETPRAQPVLFVPPRSHSKATRKTGSVNKDDGPFSHYWGAWGRPRQRN